MDTQFNKEQRLEIIFKQDKKSENIILLDNEKDMYESTPCLSIIENVKTSLIFYSDDINAKFYMDGIDILPENILEQDEYGRPYLTSSNEEIDLFMLNNFPLIPGIYRIKVIYKDKKYYSLIEVKPKLLNEYEWLKIKDDLEAEMKGLATQLIRKNKSIGSIYDKYIPPEHLYRFYIIEQYFANVMAALMDLRIKPSHRIIKKYERIEENKIRRIDKKTVRSYLSDIAHKGNINAPIRRLTYDLPENQLLKKIVLDLILWLEEFLIATENFLAKEKKKTLELIKYKNNNILGLKEHEKVLEFLELLKEQADKMIKSFKILTTTEWYSSISNVNVKYIPHIMYSDYRYNCIYRLYSKLKNSKCDIEISKKLAFQWKSTDKLYEMWGFIRLCKLLSGLDNFKICSGWIFDFKAEESKILIPDLEQGSKILFKNEEDVTIQLVYDEKIPYVSEKTSLYDKPMYVKGKKNRPDARIDIYKKDIYIGSILIDFKYRPRNYIWESNKLDNPSHVMQQLTAYETQCASIYLYGKKHIRQNNPIFEVWIIHPKGVGRGNIIEEIKDRTLKFIKLRPEIGEEELIKKFQQSLNNILQCASEEGIV